MPMLCRTLGRALGCCLLVALLAGLAGCQVPNSVLRRQGIEAYQLGRLNQAEAPFAQAVAQDPADWKAAYYLGEIYLTQGRYADAALLLEQAYNLRSNHPETPDILDALAEAMYQLDRTSRLLTMVRQQAEQRGTARAYLRQARYLWKTGDADAAHNAYLKAAHFAKGDDPSPYVAMADFYEAVGDREAALKALRQAYTIDPRNAEVANRLRRYGVVPGPTINLPAERAEILDRP